MRRQDKQILDPAEIDAIIYKAEICRLALAIDNEPYLVPLNFGYDGEAIYLHTAGSGRKITFFETNPRVCFEFEGDCELVVDPHKACRWTMLFSSVIGYGRISELVSDEEKRFGLNQIMRHYSGTDWEFSASELPPTRLWRIAVESLSGKRSPAKGGHQESR